jgi:hypothetical protein
MALNLAPILIGIGAFWFLTQREEGGRVLPEGGPCHDLEGIYKFRDSNKPGDILKGNPATSDPSLQYLPITEDAFNSIRQFIAKSFTDNPNAVYDIGVAGPFANSMEALRDKVVFETERHLTSHLDPSCPWNLPNQYTSRMEIVHNAVKKIYDRMVCRNLPGIWTPAQGNNLPITQNFAPIARAEMTAVLNANPNRSKSDAIVTTLNNLFGEIGCGWAGANYQTPMSDRQNELLASMGVLYDRIRSGN